MKINKYAAGSKADAVRQSLRFSGFGERASPETTPPSQPTPMPPARQRRRGEFTYPDASSIDPRDPSTFGFTEIGFVLGAHGTHGEIKISSDSDYARERLCSAGAVWLRRRRRRAPRQEAVVRGRKGPGSNVWLITLAGVSSREEAAALKGASLHVRREMRPALDEDELMLWELEGLTVALALANADAEAAAGDGDAGWSVGRTLGRVSGVIPRTELTGGIELGHDLLELSLAQGDAEPGAEPQTVLLPFVSPVVAEVRLDEGVLLVEPPDGLLEMVQPRRQRRVVIKGLLPSAAHG